MNTLDKVKNVIVDATDEIFEPGSPRNYIRNAIAALLLGSAIGSIAGIASNPDIDIKDRIESIADDVVGALGKALG